MKQQDIPLPVGVTAKDLEYPSYESRERTPSNKVVGQFELWYTERFKWCIPTLHISKARRGSGFQDRTYGTTLDGQLVTMGKGPHILRTVTVYVRENRLADLQGYLDIKAAGEAKAGDTRDRISTRRANTMARRNPLDFL